MNSSKEENANETSSKLTHLDSKGQASMVDVSSKDSTVRQATASAVVNMAESTLQLIQSGSGKKGEVLQVARLAGIMAAKKTDDLIPLCHGLALSSVKVDFEFISTSQIKVTATTRCIGQTGVEMEAMVAASVASLTIYDMCKAVDRGMKVSDIQLDEKLGGKSGHWKREDLQS